MTCVYVCSSCVEQLGLKDGAHEAPLVGDGWTDNLEGALAVGMHHDAVAGTARQSVTDDYEQRVAEVARRAGRLGQNGT